MLKNLTPHLVTVVNDQNQVILEVAPEETSARCLVKREVAFLADGIQVNRNVYGEISGLPDPVQGTWYIVSRIVAEAAKRHDLLVPDETVRDQNGQISGCKSFAIIY